MKGETRSSMRRRPECDGQFHGSVHGPGHHGQSTDRGRPVELAIYHHLHGSGHPFLVTRVIGPERPYRGRDVKESRSLCTSNERLLPMTGLDGGQVAGDLNAEG